MINKRRCTETPWDSIARTLARSHLYDDVIEAYEILRLGELLTLVLALAGQVLLQRLDHQQVALARLRLAQVGQVGVQEDVIGHAALQLLTAHHRLVHLLGVRSDTSSLVDQLTVSSSTK